jgi:hypothetical protein
MSEAFRLGFFIQPVHPPTRCYAPAPAWSSGRTRTTQESTYTYT